MKKLIIKTTLIFIVIYLVSFALAGTLTLANLIIAIYGLRLVNRKDTKPIKVLILLLIIVQSSFLIWFLR